MSRAGKGPKGPRPPHDADEIPWLPAEITELPTELPTKPAATRPAKRPAKRPRARIKRTRALAAMKALGLDALQRLQATERFHRVCDWDRENYTGKALPAPGDLKRDVVHDAFVEFELEEAERVKRGR